MGINEKNDIRTFKFGWAKNPNENIDDSAVVLQDNKPVIKVVNFDGKSSFRTLEELWALRSDIVVSFGTFTSIGLEVLRLRASYGAELIRKALKEVGLSRLRV